MDIPIPTTGAIKRFFSALKRFNIMETLREYRRILYIARKPGKKEFSEILKICGIGIILIGLIGFIIQTLIQLLQGGIA